MDNSTDPNVGFKNLARIWTLPSGMALNVDYDFIASIAWLDEPSILFGHMTMLKIEETINKLQTNHGVRVSDRCPRGYTIYRPEPDRILQESRPITDTVSVNQGVVPYKGPDVHSG